MCGFVALLAPSGQRVPAAVLRGMTACLAHRGPDDIGFACIDPSSGAIQVWGQDLPDHLSLAGLLFGHRRLSILDLTPAGHQPMVSGESGSVLCFNGAIYNFLELRGRLSAEGVSFRGTGDTEVLLKAYERWGLQALPRLNGMWAFVLWDNLRRTLVASRDRFGVKPLYHTTVDGVQIFGSEIKAVLAYPGASRGFEDRRVTDFLRDGLTDHTDQTMFHGIRSLTPGTSLEVSGGRSATARYWSLPSPGPADHRAPEDLIAEFRELLTDAVGLRLRADVPVGTMMSGGLDSTAITALIRNRSFDGSRSSHHSFSACWPGSANNEEAEIDAMCARLGLVCHKLYPKAEAIADALPALAYHLDEPFFDPIAAVQYLLMREAQAQGIKVVLNGHGSDEILAGYYRRFVPVFLADLLLSGRLRSFHREQRAFRGIGSSWRGVFRQVLAQLMPPPAGIDPLTSHWLTGPPTREDILADPAPGAEPDATDSRGVPPGFTPLNAALWFQFSIRNVPRWLRMEDRVSMAASVESRLPFLDYRLVEFAFALPDDLKLRDGYSKYILRQAMRDLLPERMVNNRVKRQFLAPYRIWLRGPWRPMVNDLLAAPGRVAPYLNYPRFREKLRSFLAGNDRALNPAQLWRVLSVELWMRAFSDGGRVPTWGLGTASKRS